MSGDIKQFPASELKLERLRKKGVIPLSRDFVVPGVFCGFFLGILLFVFNLAPSFVRSFEKMLRTAHEMSLEKERMASEFQDAGELFFFVFGGFLIPLLFSVFLLLLLQTRFLFSLGAALPRVERVFSFRQLRGSAVRARTATVFFDILKVALFLFGAFFCFSKAFHALPDLLSLSLFSFDLSSWAKLFLPIISFAIAFSILVGVLSRIAVLQIFAKEHQMSRQEVEQEARETEMKPGLRKAFRR